MMLSILNNHNVLKSHIVLKVESIKIRNMHRSTNKVINMNLIRQNNTTLQCNSRNMSCYHGTTLKARVPKPKVTDTDTSGFHKIITQTTCAETNCKSVNCADPNDINANCPGRTAQQNQTSIPPTQQGFVTEIKGNTTSKIPQKKTGFTLNQNQNYTGQAKKQEVVIESTPVKINSSELDVDQPSTTFAQGHHSTLEKNIP